MTGARVQGPITADQTTSALASDGARLVAGLGGHAMTMVRGDASLLITGGFIPTLNGVLTIRTTAAVDDVRGLLDIVAATNLPHSIMIRPGCDEKIVRLAIEQGFTEEEAIPLMVMPRDMERVRAASLLPELSIRVLRPEEAGLHASIAAAGFEVPLDMFERLVTPSVLSVPGHLAYVGTVEGEPVTTAMSSTDGDHVGIFDVATLPRHRGKGYGAAITARAALDGFEAGATYAYLQSSPMGLRVYERLGFRTLESWSVWVSPGQPEPVA